MSLIVIKCKINPLHQQWIGRKRSELERKIETSNKNFLFLVNNWAVWCRRNTFRAVVRILTYLLTYLLTPWCRVLPEQLTVLQLVKKFPAFHVTRRFITALTSIHHLSLSWASPIQSTYPHPISWRSVVGIHPFESQPVWRHDFVVF
jgi:hypothetical protein